MLKRVSDQLPQKIPYEAYEKAIQAIANIDTNTRAFGRKVFLFLNMKTLLSVVGSFYNEALDTPEDRDEMLTATIAYLMEKVNEGVTIINTKISGRVNSIARDGIVKFLIEKYDMPNGLIKDPYEKLLVLTKIKEEFEIGFSTGKSIKKLAQELSEETGVDKKEILNWLMFLNAGRKSEKKGLTLLQKEDVYFTVDLKEQMKKVLNTLHDREGRVLELRFGLEGSRYPGESMTLEEVGYEFGVTRERIRQIEVKALRKLRHPSRSKRLEVYLYPDRYSAMMEAEQQKTETEDFQRYTVDKIDFDREEIKEQLKASGIKEIGDLFSASPQEILEEWTGDPEDLKKAVEVVCRGILGDLYSTISSNPRSNEIDKNLLYYIANAVFYREFHGRISENEPSKKAKDAFKKAYEDLASFFLQEDEN